MYAPSFLVLSGEDANRALTQGQVNGKIVY